MCKSGAGWLAAGLAVLLVGCGESEPAATEQTAATKQPPKSVCGYDASAAIPAAAGQVLPGNPALVSSEGDPRTEALVDLPFKDAYDAIVKRAKQNGWTLEDHERESADAEMELTHNGERLSLSLSPSGIAGCTATRVSVLADSGE